MTYIRSIEIKIKWLSALLAAHRALNLSHFYSSFVLLSSHSITIALFSGLGLFIQANRSFAGEAVGVRGRIRCRKLISELA